MSPPYSRSWCIFAGMRSSSGTTRTPKSALRSARARSSSSTAFGFDSRDAFASNTMRPRAGPVQPSIATTTSPVLPVPPLTSPTASQSSPCRTAISSSATDTASSNERPLAVPRRASCATASAFSFSDRARSSSSRSPWIVWFISCRRALCWSDDCLTTASDARW